MSTQSTMKQGLSLERSSSCGYSTSSCTSWPNSPLSGEVGPESWQYASPKATKVVLCDMERGFGVNCNEHLNAGTVVVCEKPLLKFRIGDSVEKLVRKELSKDEQRDYFSLCDNLSNSGVCEKSSVGVCQTNAIALSPKVQGILRMGSRINHSCKPNLSYRYDPESDIVEFYTIADTAPGEELCISYIDNIKRRDVRRAMLRKRYGFECHCEVCSRQGKSLEESENTRDRIEQLDESILLTVHNKDFEKALTLVEKRLKLLNSEPGLNTPMNLLRTEYDALRISQELGNLELMHKWGYICVTHAAVAHGVTSPIYQSLCSKIQDIPLLEAIELLQ
mmetsp:Transcript_6220/g.9818  ORF Transcript_6220/g.9818 Transcript_6220/m.9818 type:complete len:335 (-) Transcript_6220:1587-2591(-)